MTGGNVNKLSQYVYVHSNVLTAAPSMRVGVLGRVLAILQAKEAMIASEDDKCLFLGVLFIQRHCTVYMFDDFVGTIKMY